MLDNSTIHLIGMIPVVCQMPVMANNKSIGAKMQPRYKCSDRNCAINAGFTVRAAGAGTDGFAAVAATGAADWPMVTSGF